MPRGGARPNTGPKLGSKHKATISKDLAREAFRVAVMKHFEELIASQVANAKGIKYLVARGPGGKFERIGPEGVNQDAVIEVWEKDPSVQAFTDLMNRTLDKPVEAMSVNHSGAIRLTHEI